MPLGYLLRIPNGIPYIEKGMAIRVDKFYNANDMVKISCNDCKGCSACCRGMGQSIILNPLDIYRLSIGLNRSFEELLQQLVELHVEEGIIVPNLKMQEKKDCCGLLDENGRCMAHAFRPGLCRLFPLGRNYENHSFQYFVVENACMAGQKSKVKISKWLQEPSLSENEKFITDWHYFIKDMKDVIKWLQEEELAKQINMLILQEFFIKPYEPVEDFYKQYKERKEYTESALQKIANINKQS